MKNFMLNVKKIIELRGLPLVLASTLALTGLAGCSKKADCDVKEMHAHLYTNEDGLQRYCVSEQVSYEGYERQEEAIPLTEEEASLHKFLAKKDFIKLEDNLDVILAKQSQNQDYVEYEYWDTMPGGPMGMPIINQVYDWTSDPSHENLTGETRFCHYVYQAYNVMKDEHGKWVVIPSEQVDDIRDLIGEYDYVKTVSYETVVLEDALENDKTAGSLKLEKTKR